MDMRKEAGHMCYALTLLIPGVRLTVGPNTSLTLLLKSTLVQATLYALTKDQHYRVKEMLRRTDSPPPQSYRPLAVDIPEAPYRPCSPTSSTPPTPRRKRVRFD